MKKIILSLLLISVFVPQRVLAHTADQPPYLQIGGTYTKVYPVYGSTVDALSVPNDIAADTFLVNIPVVFAMTEANLPLPQAMLAKINFSWDFGDGVKVSGSSSVSHPYTKLGSYIASVYAVPSAELGTDPILLQSTLIHVVPDKTYKIPQAVLMVNGKVIRDPLVDVMRLSLNEPVQFDASESTAGNNIVSYQWDFGDKVYKETTDSKLTYTYQLEKYKYGLPLAFVVLRVKDANGFIADTYAQITNTTSRTSGEQSPPYKPTILSQSLLALLLLVILTIGFIFFRKRNVRTKVKK